MLIKVNDKLNQLIKNTKLLKEIHLWFMWKYHDLHNYVYYGKIDFPNDFNIETTTYCNRRCPFCPNSKYDRGLKKNEIRMPFEMYKKIIDELTEYHFRGRIGPHFYGEPLTDERLPDFIKYTKEKLPRCRININTNGDFLTIDKFNQLLSLGVNQILVSQYDKEQTRNMKNLLEYLKNKLTKKKKLICKVFKEDSYLSNRGGEIKVNKTMVPRCHSPVNPMVIDALGNVVLCCNDYHSSVILGNVGVESIMEIWNKPGYKKLRREFRVGIYSLPICKRCVNGL